MRNLVALLALVCCCAQADDPAVVIAPAAGLPGRYIQITSAQVPMCGDGERLAVYPSATGYNIAGCWHAHGAYFFVRWQDGDFGAYPISVFKPQGVQL